MKLLREMDDSFLVRSLCSLNLSLLSHPQLRPQLADSVADGPDCDARRRLRGQELELAGHAVGPEGHGVVF